MAYKANDQTHERNEANFSKIRQTAGLAQQREHQKGPDDLGNETDSHLFVHVHVGTLRHYIYKSAQLILTMVLFRERQKVNALLR